MKQQAIEFNLNQYIRFRLTAYGRVCAERLKQDIREQCPTLGDYDPYPVDKDGYCRGQMWCVMSWPNCWQRKAR